jgi:hypothetical protein
MADDLRQHPEKLEALIAKAQAPTDGSQWPDAFGRRLKHLMPRLVTILATGVAAIIWWCKRERRERN